MKPVLVLQHVPHETLGALEPHLIVAGLTVQPIELYLGAPERLDLEQASALIVMGGPMNVDETDRYPFLGKEVRWIQEALAQDVPVLGICLGSQLLAKSLGAKVYPNHVKEIGWYEVELTAEASRDLLFADCGPREVVFQWHGDTFDLPAGAVHLAASESCRHQAFRYGSSAWGLQFHAEMTTALVEDWLANPGNCEELAVLDYVDPGAIRAQTPAMLPRMQSLGRRILRRFVALCRERSLS